MAVILCAMKIDLVIGGYEIIYANDFLAHYSIKTCITGDDDARLFNWHSRTNTQTKYFHEKIKLGAHGNGRWHFHGNNDKKKTWQNGNNENKIKTQNKWQKKTLISIWTLLHIGPSYFSVDLNVSFEI